ncbi:hypothetical protein F5884DRAFT_823466 [Xylogone sp. PMI_703]|nr:hypothetical protein F5884DRAFT_823466 [Xylogone sp. PMI_703]
MRSFRLIVATVLATLAASLSADTQHTLQEQYSLSTTSLISLHKSLIERPSITGAEKDVSSFLIDYLKGKGFTVKAQAVSEVRENVLAFLGDSPETRILVTSHIDTVPPFWPYERRGDEIWGRGSVDAKGSVASQIIAVESLIKESKISEGDVALLFVVGEEHGGAGMRAANDLGLSWEAVIFGEPTELKLGSGHKGGIGFTIKAKGKAGHSGYPELGRNANNMLVRALASLDRLKLPWSERYGNTTINLGTINGGVAANVIAEDANATLSVRIAAGGPESIKELVETAVYEASPDVEIEFGLGIGPVPIDHDIDGFETIVLNYGTDIPALKGNHKRYLYGPGSILVAHSDHEHVSISDLEKAVEGYKTLILETLKRKS